MGEFILGTTMSLDGTINDLHGGLEALYPNPDTWRETEPGRESS